MPLLRVHGGQPVHARERRSLLVVEPRVHSVLEAELHDAGNFAPAAGCESGLLQLLRQGARAALPVLEAARGEEKKEGGVNQAGMGEQVQGIGAGMARCASDGCLGLAARGDEHCRRCREEIDGLEEMVRETDRKREVRALRKALWKHDVVERWQRVKMRVKMRAGMRVGAWLKASARVWALRANWTFLAGACLWIGWELGAAALAFLRSRQ
jgi:hypothetical protein